jgi:hypothetical protein
MYTSLFVLALAGAPLGANAPSWQSYSQASQAVEQEKKPIAVFLGSGQKGWETVAGSLSSEAEQVLAAGYLCAYVDTTTPEGEKLAQAFDIKSGVGLVLSDRKGLKQAFWHQGTLRQSDLVQQLVRYSPTSRTSMYYETTATTATGTLLSGSSSYCPTCSGGTVSSVRRR